MEKAVLKDNPNDRRELYYLSQSGIMIHNPMRAIRLVPSILLSFHDTHPTSNLYLKRDKMVNRLATVQSLRNQFIVYSLTTLSVIVTFVLFIAGCYRLHLLITNQDLSMLGWPIGMAIIAVMLWVYMILRDWFPHKGDYDFKVKHKGRHVRESY